MFRILRNKEAIRPHRKPHSLLEGLKNVGAMTYRALQALVGNPSADKSDFDFHSWPFYHTFFFLMGIPVRHRKYNIFSILKNLFAWPHPDAPGWQKVVSYFFIVPVFITHLLLAIPNLLLNALKLFTEVLPVVLISLFDEALDLMPFLEEKVDKSFESDEMHDALYVGIILGIKLVIPVLWIGFAASHVLLFIGRALTSPLASVRELWEMVTTMSQ